MTQGSERELFETVPVPRAVATLAIPTVISQVVTMIYNLADTFFIGQTGDPLMVAAVSLVSPWFNLLTALGNLFGLGGSSLISRMLGIKRESEIRYVSSFSIWAGAAVTACFSLASFLARGQLLTFLGASPDNYGYADVGGRRGRCADNGEPRPWASAPQRGTRKRGQRGHDVRRHSECDPRSHSDFRF